MQMKQSFINAFFASFLEWALASDQVQTTNSLPCHVIYALNDAIAMHMPKGAQLKRPAKAYLFSTAVLLSPFPFLFPPTVFLSPTI